MHGRQVSLMTIFLFIISISVLVVLWTIPEEKVRTSIIQSLRQPIPKGVLTTLSLLVTIPTAWLMLRNPYPRYRKPKS